MIKITLEEFTKLYDPIPRYQKEYKNAEKGLSLLTPSSFVVPELGGFLLDSYISLLEKYLCIEDEDIGYFVYECNDRPGSVTVNVGKENEKTYSISNIEELYFYLTETSE